jgi:flagellar biosynthesis GTPase FlhF
MSIRAIPRTAIGGSIKAVRLPLDIAVSLLPGNGAGPRPSAGLALDRIEAHVRDLAGAALGDEVLREDAGRRRVAADERERALRLRAAGARRTSAADERLADTQQDAEELREQAAERARGQRAEAAKLRRQRSQEAARVERTRRAASENAREKVDETIDEQAAAARLEQLEREAAALDEQANAITAQDEAQRLQDAATRRKAARRKSG